MTERLFYTDSYLREFRAAVIETGDAGRVYLDRTAFYPASGGQPHDTGTIAGIPVVEVVEEEGRIAHITSAPVAVGQADCRIDWPRRFDHMQQHSGQHLLSAVLVELYGATTVSFHLGAESSTIDVAAASLSGGQLAAVEARANEVVFENRLVSISFEDDAEAAGLRKASEREGTLRVVTIAGLDRSACGGTHVRSTGEIGPVLLRKVDRAHGNLRIEFLCGMRAVRRARADFDALSGVARTLSVALDAAPGQAAAQAQLLETAEKARRRAAIELAQLRGRELYRSTTPDAAGLRSVVDRVAAGVSGEEVRAKAQGFTAEPKACFLAVIESEQPTVLVAVSNDAGIHAGNVLKEALAKLGGRGGGSPRMGQGSLPSPAALDELLRVLRDALGLRP